MGTLHGVEPWVLASSMSRRCLVSAALSAKNQALKMLPKCGTKSSGKQFCGILFRVKVFTFMAVLLGHDESGPMLGVKMLVGPRRRPVYCEVHMACRDGMLSYQERKQFTAEAV